ncbi:MAG: polysaccharide export protein EpsE [Variovorax sp.]|nr:polysaccharide export protein EpsE [Variovorax sp.]
MLPAHAQSAPDLALEAGDDIRIKVFQNPDLSFDSRVPESGTISYPLIGSVQIGGLSISAAEKRIADALRTGGFVLQPQVNIVVLQARGSQVSVLGQVTKPGRFPLETSSARVTDVLAMAGGATLTGDDVAVLTGTRNSKPFRRVIDIPAIFLNGNSDDNMVVAAGDTLYVPRAPVFYIYGEAQKPGSYRIERGMTVMKALATGGGPTVRGSESRLRLTRKNAKGVEEQFTPEANDLVRPDDVIYVRESIF